MRNFKHILLAAAVASLAISALDGAAFARGAAGGGAGGGSGGGTGGAGAGSNPFITANSTLPGGHRIPVARQDRQFTASCYKQEPLFDRYGNVVNLHGVDCDE